jgi:hypothetical protein
LKPGQSDSVEEDNMILNRWDGEKADEGGIAPNDASKSAE